MDKVEAYEIIQRTLEEFQKKSFDELINKIGLTDSIDYLSSTSVSYEISVVVNWTDKRKKEIRVEASISDLNWYKFSPITEHVVIKLAC